MQNKTEHPHKNKTHRVLAHSYLVYLVLLLVALCLDSIFEFKLFTDSFMMPVGFLFLLLASAIIVWAQKSGRNFRKVKEKRTEHFCTGPYCYSRIPTQWGLLFLILGFGIITNSFFVIIFTIVAFLISKFVFMSKHDDILEAKYGSHYLEYKKSVRF